MPDILHDHPGFLFVAATLVPLLSFLLLLVLFGAWSLLRRYRDNDAVENVYNLFGGDKSGPSAAYVATGAIALSFLLSLTGAILFLVDAPEREKARLTHEQEVETIRAKQAKGAGERSELEEKLRGEQEKLQELDARWSARCDWLRIAPANLSDPDRGTVLQLGYRIDSLSVVMFVMVTFIATLIHLFSIGYMSDELEETVADHQVHTEYGHLHRRGRFGRFFLFLSLFCFSMLNLVLADNLFQVFLSWELVGICSYLLVGFYFERKSASNAANKAFIVNRVGDAGFIIGLLILWTFVGTFNFEDLFHQIRSPLRDSEGGLTLGGQFVRGEANRASYVFVHNIHDEPPLEDRDVLLVAPDDPKGTDVVLFPRAPSENFKAIGPHGTEEMDWSKPPLVPVMDHPKPNQFGSMPYWMLVVAGLGIFLGCVGKSAQFPLHVWLPDAMEGPTPVSALIHAATMVAAGVYLVGRVYPLFTPEALLIIAYVGGITLFVAATVAVVMTDIKKVLAYSTVSQLGYMMLALGVGGWTAGLFHLVTHAFFKALLFLGSGSVIHGCHHEQDMLKMGGLYSKMKVTAITMLMGVLSISGVMLFSGWYSKDAVLAAAYGFMKLHPQHAILFLLPLVTAGITTFYMFRMWFLTFTGKPRDAHIHENAHESPPTMTVPLIVLAIWSVAVAWGWPPWDPDKSFLEKEIHESQPASVVADFGRVAEDDKLWEGGRIKEETRSERVLAKASHSMAGALAMGLVVLGVVFALLMYYYRAPGMDPADSKEQFAGIHTFLTNKWYFDELYSAIIVRPALVVAHWFRVFDLAAIDGFIHFVARAAVGVAKWDGIFDNGVVDGLVNLTANVIHGVGASLRTVQTGFLRNYVLFLVLAAAGAFLVLTYFVSLGWAR